MNLSLKQLDSLFNLIVEENQSKIIEKQKYKDYYDGKHEILNKEAKSPNKPNNILMFNFPELIVESIHSYLFSNAISYEVKTDDELTLKFKEHLEKIFFDNEEEATTNSLGKTSIILGKSNEVMYISEQEADKEGFKKIKFEEANSLEFIWFEFDDGTGKQKYCLRNYTVEELKVNKDDVENVEIEKFVLYSKDYIKKYQRTEKGLEITEEKTHLFGEIPIINYLNKSTFGNEGNSDLKNVISLVDAYNKAMSAIADIIENNADPKLLLINLGLSEEDYKEMQANGLLSFVSDPEVKSEAKYLFFDNNITAYEQFLDRLVRKIFLLSFTPDIFTKEGKANSDSGEALKMKFYGSADIKGNGKILAFKKGLRTRIRMIARQLENAGFGNFYSEGVYRNILINFEKNIPKNQKELFETLTKAMPLLSHHTILQQIPFINADEEMEKKKEEVGQAISFQDDNLDFED